MRAFKLALSLLLIPKLFLSLVFFPLILSILLVYLQLVATGLILKGADRDARSLESGLRSLQHSNLTKRFLFKGGESPTQLRICRWQTILRADGKVIEVPSADAACTPDRLDAALMVQDPRTFDPSSYIPIFKGNTERLHICRTCRPDLVIDLRTETPKANIYSIWGAMVLGLVQFNDSIIGPRIEAYQGYDQIMQLLGEIYFHWHGMKSPANISQAKGSLALIFNIASIVIITLWLAMKAHRKVLDYFSDSGVLLPMVAAMGKQEFYSAIWLLTAFRVVAFLLASLPMLYLGFSQFESSSWISSFQTFEFLDCVVWILAISSSLGLATLVASIADLKHRHHLLSFAYRYVPLFLAIIGSMAWVLSFVGDGELAKIVRDVVGALPLFGMTPILVAPVFEPGLAVLASHAVLTLVLFLLIMKQNARWFAAHLEEI